ncbi:hypothetical protein RSAG8_04796, partial [Rhizoctonia solani AG-8 WAC10335]
MRDGRWTSERSKEKHDTGGSSQAEDMRKYHIPITVVVDLCTLVAWNTIWRSYRAKQVDAKGA